VRSASPADAARQRSALIWVVACWLSACATWNNHTPPSKLAADSRIAMTVKRATGRLYLQVLVGDPCTGGSESPCPAGEPVEGLTLAVQTSQGPRELGVTSPEGELDLPFSALDPIFAGEEVAKDQRAPLLVEGRSVAELPIGEIVHRHEILESAIEECDAALSNPQLDDHYAQSLLGRMLDLQLLGIADARLEARTSRLYRRLRDKPSDWWSPQRVLDDTRQLIAGLGRETGLPMEVERDVTTEHADERLEPESFSWALERLPQLCKVSVVGGAIVAQVAVVGTPGLVLAVLGAAVGNVFSDWLVDTCCKQASEIFDVPQEEVACQRD
jgi:hypothetical protein